MKTVFIILLVMIFGIAGAMGDNRISDIVGVIMLAIGIAGTALKVKMMELKGR